MTESSESTAHEEEELNSTTTTTNDNNGKETTIALDSTIATDDGHDQHDIFGETTTTGRRADITDDLTLANGQVSLVEVRAFRASIPARRFPAIRDMTDEQIAQIVAKDKAARQSHPWDNTTQMDPLDDFRCSKTVVQNELKTPTTRRSKKLYSPFSPCNARAARDTIARNDKERFLTVGTQYDEGMKQYLSMKAFDESKRLAAPFKPNSASQAKKMTRIDYFMNSPLFNNNNTTASNTSGLLLNTANNTLSARRAMENRMKAAHAATS